MKKLSNLSRVDVKRLARDLALKYKNKDAVIGLSGPLGAGKTAFTKDFASFLGIKRIKSPTFLVVAQYKTKRGDLYHLDLYRLDSIKQLDSLAFDEILRQKNRIVIIEWVEKFPIVAKRCDLILKFEITGKDLRNVSIN